MKINEHCEICNKRGGCKLIPREIVLTSWVCEKGKEEKK